MTLKWHDNSHNSIVTLATHFYNVRPIQKVDRIGSVRKKRSKLQVACPAYMAGVNRFDENANHLQRTKIKKKKN